MAKYAVIIVAAGKGERFGGKENKIFTKIDGQPMFLKTIQHFINREDVAETILVVGPDNEEQVKSKYGPNLGFMGVTLAIGGETRTDSVANGLALVPEEAEYVAVHDAARPCVSEAMINDVFAEAAKTGAAILAAPLTGTLKRGSDAQIIEETLPRDGLWEAQTPQVFRKDLITDAYDKRSAFEGTPTDDAQLVEALGHPVHLVTSDFSNLKVTTPGDTKLANAIVKSRPKPKPKSTLGAFEEAQW